MKKYYPLIFLLAVILTACKKNNLSPNTNNVDSAAKTGNTINSQTSANDEALVIGNWTWSSQYTFAQTLYTLNPTNTGVQETLQFNANGTWTQTKNGAVAKTGTYSFPEVMTPAGTAIPFFSAVNNRVTDTARYDNFNFNTGFAGSFHLTQDSLVFFGVNTIDTTGTEYIAERVYVR